MTKAEDWLPPNIALAKRVRSQLDATVTVWSREWFANRNVSVARVDQVSSETAAVGASNWTILTPGVAMAPNSAARKLARWALDAPPEGEPSGELDDALLQRFGAQVAQDLAARLHRALGADQAIGGSSSVQGVPTSGAMLTIEGSMSGGGAISIVLDQSLVIGFLKQALGPASPRPRVEPIGSAVGKQTVRLEARAGEVSLELSQLQSLEVGDLLVLEAPVCDGVGVGVAGADHRLFRGSLVASEGQRAVAVF